MKQKIDRLNIDDMFTSRNLLYFLLQLRIKEVNKVLDALDITIYNDFCKYCDLHEDYCKCGDYYKYGGRTCRDHYDEED